MKKVFVSSAEWNPSNQIILTVAECNEVGCQFPATRKKIILENIEEDFATSETVVSKLAEMEMDVFNKKVQVY